MLDDQTEAKIDELADELYEAHVEDQNIRFWEGGIVQTVPTGAAPEYITVEIEGIYDENVMWRGVPASLVVGDEVWVWENPITHRREIGGGSGATGTSTSSPWQKVTVAVFGGDFALLSAAITWINALPGAIGPAATRQFAINVRGGTFVEAADVTIPQYVHVGGEGEGTVLDMGDATLVMSADTSLQEIIVTSTADDNWYVVLLDYAHNAVIDDVRVIVTGSLGNQECIYVYRTNDFEFYHVICESTHTTNYGFDIYKSTGLLWDCKADDTTNFDTALTLNTAANPGTTTTKFCEFHAASAGDDVEVEANNTWNHFACNYDPANSTITGTENALLHGRTRFADKVVAGSFGTPVDVQVTRAGEYGFEIHYSGNNYNVTTIRARASLITTDAAARTAQAAKLQAANADGIDAGVVQGALIEGIGKSNASAATITDLRGALVNTEWDDFDTVTDLKTLYVRTHTRHSAVAGYISNTGYLVYLENEAVGGNGQMLNAAIYVKATNVSTPMAFDYCIDLIGAANEVNTADIRLSSGGTLGGAGAEHIVIETDGSMIFTGTATVFNDIYFPMTTGKIGGANQPTWAAFQGNTFEYTFGINDYIHLPSQEISHSYFEGSNITLHAHIVLDGSDVGNTDVNYEIEYTIGDMTEVMSAAAVVTSGDYTIPGGTADRTHLYIAIGTIAGATYLMGAALKMRFRRIALVGGGNAPGNDPFVLMAGAHIEQDTVGSRTELAK